MHDVVIRGGTLVDGTGASARTGDIGIDGDRITAVGNVGSGKREIDARGHLVTPGFVDIHTHYDAQVTWDPYLTPSSWHGCTTVVMGNCGVGFAPARPEKREWLIGLMEGVEDIPGAALVEGIQWEWESYPEYLDALAKRHCALDFGSQIPHGALRAYVMEERGADNQDATAEDMARMADLVEAGIRAGALGFSTSRTLLHKGIDGRHVPGTFAPKDELYALAGAVQKGGGGVFQLACEHAQVPDELTLMGDISRRFNLPVMFNLSQFDGSPELWKTVEEKLTQVNQEPGTWVRAQVAGRAIGVVMAWRGTAHPFALKPSWLQIMHSGWEHQWSRLQDPEFRQRLIEEEPMHIGDFEAFVTQSFHKMYLLSDGYEPTQEQSIASLAAARGISPAQLAMDILMERDGKGMLYFPLFNYSDNSLDVLERLHQSTYTRMGLSDAGAHCGAVCDGGMPTFMLSHWTRDRTRGMKLPLEWIISRQTAQTAEAYGFLDRGVLKEGYRADINIINYDELALGAPELVWDLPAGGRRLIQRPTGYIATLCRGVVTAENGEPTGELPGRLVRGRQSAPARGWVRTGS